MKKVKEKVPTPEDIRKIRENMELTQDEFSTELEISTTTLSRWENGKSIPRTVRTKKTLKKLAKKFLAKEATVG